MNYTDPTLVATSLKRDLTENEQATLATLLPAIDKWIDKKIGTTFIAATGYTDRYYDGDDITLDIEPCTDIQEIASVNSYDGTDLYLYNQSGIFEVLAEPRNETIKNELRHRGGQFPCGENNIRVNAKFSSYVDGTPEDIQIAATLIAIDCLRLKQMGTDNLKRESLEGHEVMYHDPNITVQSIGMNNPVVCQILEPYIERVLG